MSNQSLEFCDLSECNDADCTVKRIWVCRDPRGSASKIEIIDNSNKINCLIKVDAGLLPHPNRKKCDFLFVNCDTKTAYLIELKGSDLNHAVEQIISTLELLGSIVGKFTTVNARIVVSRVCAPAIRTTSITRLKNMLTGLHGDLMYKARLMRILIS